MLFGLWERSGRFWPRRQPQPSSQHPAVAAAFRHGQLRAVNVAASMGAGARRAWVYFGARSTSGAGAVRRGRCSRPRGVPLRELMLSAHPRPRAVAVSPLAAMAVMFLTLGLLFGLRAGAHGVAGPLAWPAALAGGLFWRRGICGIFAAVASDPSALGRAVQLGLAAAIGSLSKLLIAGQPGALTASSGC